MVKDRIKDRERAKVTALPPEDEGPQNGDERQTIEKKRGCFKVVRDAVGVLNERGIGIALLEKPGKHFKGSMLGR